MLKFEKPDPNKIKERERLLQEAKQASDEAVGLAQNCLNNEMFIKYKQQYERLTPMIIEKLILLDEVESDPLKYALQVKGIITEYRVIGSLLRGVKNEAGKRI